VWKLWCGSGSLGGGEFELRQPQLLSIELDKHLIDD